MISPFSKVSIHAAQAGCDSPIPTPIHYIKCFNSRSPSGLRQFTKRGWRKWNRFNSRSPSGLRQPRIISKQGPSSFNSRSPSGLRPVFFLSFDHLFQRFNSRSPSGLRQFIPCAMLSRFMFQFTQPKRAATCAALGE